MIFFKKKEKKKMQSKIKYLDRLIIILHRHQIDQL